MSSKRKRTWASDKPTTAMLAVCAGATSSGSQCLTRLARRRLNRRRASGWKIKADPNKAHPNEYKIWRRMRSRCYSPNHKGYARYGARGIKICERWQRFPNFLADMGPRPGPQYSLDRIDNNGDYEPSNCRWATAEVQQNNRRDNRKFTIDGETLGMSQWARRYNVSLSRVASRLKRGLTIEQALTLPTQTGKFKRKRGECRSTPSVTELARQSSPTSVTR